MVPLIWGHAISEADKLAIVEGGNLRYLWQSAGIGLLVWQIYGYSTGVDAHHVPHPLPSDGYGKGSHEEAESPKQVEPHSHEGGTPHSH